MCDSTDAQVNMGKLKMPAGMKSTYELMAQRGVWIRAGDALQAIEQLKAEVQQRQSRFGLLRNDHHAVVEELAETIAYLKTLDGNEAQFNFTIVM
jgi:delta 1-pyrroline-5-carboxylate dehydrogenase